MLRRRREQNEARNGESEAEYAGVLNSALPFIEVLDRLRDQGQAEVPGAVDLAWTRQAAKVIDRAAWRVGRLLQESMQFQRNELARRSLQVRCEQEQAALIDAQARALTLGAWLLLREEVDVTMSQVIEAESSLWAQWRDDWVGPAKLSRGSLRRS